MVANVVTGAQRFLKGHKDDVTCVAVDPSGTLVAAGGTGHAPELLVFRADTGAIVSRFVGFHQRRVVCLAFSPNGREVRCCVVAVVGEGWGGVVINCSFVHPWPGW